MCGIVGYVGPREVVPLLVDGLKRLEYRGYDSAGVAVVENGTLARERAEGKLDRLIEKLGEHHLHGRYGVAHTRWATHGRPIEKNAHPVVDSKNRIAIIHNGIIENFLPIKRRLAAEGWTFVTDTDTEVMANLVSSYFEGDLAKAVRRAVAELEGMYACALVAAGSAEDEIVAVRQGTPLVLGLGDGEQFLASDPAALLQHTKDVVFLENGDVARLARDRVTVWNRAGEVVERAATKLSWDPIQAEKGGFKHFMAKEIHEQPQAVQDTFAGRVDFEARRVELDELVLEPDVVLGLSRIQLLACGTSWHAAQVGKFLIEELTRIPVEVDYASEYRYRDPIVDSSVLVIGVTQSGETIDTVWAMEAAKERGGRLVALSNVPGSQATRLASGVLYTHAGPEIGVASTKAFTTQLVAFYLLALYLRQQQGRAIEPELLAGLAHLPQAIAQALALESVTDELAREYQNATDFLFLGRGVQYPIALEGALKLKEISYIHAEGYPAGEMKHGPIALIDEKLPVVALVTGRRVFEKVKGNLQEVKARDGIVVAITDRDPAELDGVADRVVVVPSVSELLQPIVNVVPLQLLAYQIGVRRGCDVDQPRNLAKSVTVE
jgi:glucosamine--fructose-6-phosphate aminotransferase (isomerizing)